MTQTSNVTAPAEERPRDDHSFPGLDGIRGLAAAAVVFTHVAFATGATGEGMVGALLARLDFGVALFFLLSGFLLSRPWFVHAAGLATRVSLRVYAVRRVARIMPLYWVVLVVAVLMIPANRGASPTQIALNAGLLQIYPPDSLLQGLTQAWSLATEASFYVLLPLLAPVLARAARARGTWRPERALAALVALAVAGLAFVALARWPDGPLPSQAGFWLPYNIAWFCLGIALAVLEVSGRAGGLQRALGALRPLADHLGTCWALALAAYLLAATPIGGPRGFEAEIDSLSAVCKTTLYGVSAFFILLPMVLVPRGSGVVRMAFQSRVARWFGNTSYGVFLWHLVLLEGVMWILEIPAFTGRFIVVAALTYVATLLVADVTFRVLENPVMRAAHRVRPRASRPPRSL